VRSALLDEECRVKLKAGMQLKSAVSTVEIVVIRAPAEEVIVTCGGALMLTPDEEPSAVSGPSEIDEGDGPILGKRYANEEIGIECLCVKPGKGQLAVDGVPLPIKEAKQLPASD
jgi:hypothetical protein